MTTALITYPQSEPLTLTDLKAHLRIDHDAEDGLLIEILKAARHYCELACGQKLITQIWRQYEARIPDNRAVKLVLSPIRDVNAVTAYDRDGNPTFLTSNDYQLERTEDHYFISFAPGFDATLACNGFEIDIVVGFGDLGIDIPDTLRRAILLLVAHWFEFRGAVSPQDQPVSLPPGFDILIAPHRRVNF